MQLAATDGNGELFGLGKSPFPSSLYGQRHRRAVLDGACRTNYGDLIGTSWGATCTWVSTSSATSTASAVPTAPTASTATGGQKHQAACQQAYNGEAQQLSTKSKG